MTKDQTNEVVRATAQEEALLAILDGADPFTEGGAPNADAVDLEILGRLANLVGAQSEASALAAGKASLFDRLSLPKERVFGVSSTPVESGRPSGDLIPFRPPAPMTSRMPGWVPLALAAAVLLAVGLGAWSGFLFSEVRQMRTLVAGLESELDERARSGQLAGGNLSGGGDRFQRQDDFQKVLFENRRLREQIGVATKPKTRVCALSAVDENQPEATATVFLRPDDKEWSIATSNLAKCPLGRNYRVWFLDATGSPVGSETLDHIDGEAQYETAAGELPEGVASILVTLEYPDRTGERPSDARVLYGDHSVAIY